MRTVLTLLVVAVVSVALPAAADEADTGTAASGTGAAVAPSNAHTLAHVHGGLSADSTHIAGRSRDVEMSATKTGTKVMRPAPTPRVLRRMSPERAVASIDAQVRACAPASATVAPTATTFGLRVSVAPGGEVESSELASTMRVSPSLLACVATAMSGARFGAPGPAGASIVVPITVPGRPAAAPADTTSVTMTAVPVAAEAKPADEVASKP